MYVMIFHIYLKKSEFNNNFVNIEIVSISFTQSVRSLLTFMNKTILEKEKKN